MGQLIKPIAKLPYKSLIFNYKNLDQSDILYNDTGLNWTILSGGTGILIITADQIILQQIKYCVIVTPIRQGNNHSICVQRELAITDNIFLYCAENGNNILTDDGYDAVTVQINFFNL
jgi:hypothetical protein